MNMVEATTERESLGARIRAIDEKLETLRPRLANLRDEITKQIERENRLIRLFSDADHHEKKTIDKELTAIVAQRAAVERECKGIAITVAELEQQRTQIYPHYQRLVEIELREERKRKIEELRRAHERDQQHEQACDKALGEAKARSNRSFFAWKTAIEQQAMEELNASTERQKEEWAKISGPNAPGHRRAS